MNNTTNTNVPLLTTLSYIQSSNHLLNGVHVSESRDVMANHTTSFSCQESFLKAVTPLPRACISLIRLCQRCSLSNYALNTCLLLACSFKITVRVQRKGDTFPFAYIHYFTSWSKSAAMCSLSVGEIIPFQNQTLSKETF